MRVCLLVIPVSLWLACTAAYAVDIYRWVDERGQHQMSDRVPEKYRDAAVRIDSRRFELTPAQRVEAEARSSQVRDRIAGGNAEREVKEQRQRQLESEAAELAKAQTSNRKQSGLDPGAQSCKDQWREYMDRMGCYVPYIIGTGGLRPGWEKCIDAKSPSPACQLPTVP